MAITISVDQVIVSDEATSIISNSITALSGDTQLFIMVSVDDTTEGDITTISDSQGETITQIADFTNGNRRVRLYGIADPNLNARTITVNFDSATDAFLDLFTVQGSSSLADPSDVTATSNANNAAPDTAITPNASTGMIIWLVHQSNNSTYSALGTGQSERGQAVVGGAEKSSALFTTEIFTAAPGNQTATASKSGNWIGLAVEIKEAGVAIVQVANESLDLVEDTAKVIGLTKVNAEILDIPEDQVSHLGLVRVISEVLDIPEESVAHRARVFIGNEINELVEAANNVVAKIRVNPEVNELVEAAQFVRGRIKVAATEINDLVEAAFAILGIVKVSPEVLDLPEAANAQTGIVIRASEQLDIPETSLAHRARIFIAAEINDIVESANNVVAKIRVATTEVLDIVESSVVARALIRLKTEILEFAFSTPAAGLGTIPHAFTQVTTLQTTSSTSFVDVPGAIINQSNFVAGRKYLIYITANIRTIGVFQAEVQMVHGSTVFPESNEVDELQTAPEMKHYGWFTVWEAIASEDVKMQFRNLTGDPEVDNITMFVLELSEKLTEGVDWFFDEVIASTAMALTFSTSNNASVTFTPAIQDAYLIMGMSHMDPNRRGTRNENRIQRTGELTEEIILLNNRTEDTGGELLHLMMSERVADTVSNTFTQESKVDSTQGSPTREYSSIFVLRLNVFDGDISFLRNDAEIELPVADPDFGTEILSDGFTPTKTIDYWILGYAVCDLRISNLPRPKMRLQVDDVDQPPTQTSDSYNHKFGRATTAESNWSIQTVQNLSTFSHIIAIDGSDPIEKTPQIEDRIIFGIPLEVATGFVEALKIIGLNKIGNEILDLVETSIAHRARVFIGNEINNLVEFANNVIGKIRVNPEQLDISEQSLITRARIFIGNEINDLVEFANNVIGKIRVNPEVLEIPEQSLAHRARVFIANEINDIVEAANNVVGKIKVNPEILDIPEVVSAVRGLVRAGNEVLEIVETAIKKAVTFAQILLGRRSMDKPGFRSLDKG